MFNLNSNYLLPKIFKNFIPDNIFKSQYLKDFTIVSMFRNFIVTDPKQIKQKI